MEVKFVLHTEKRLNCKHCGNPNLLYRYSYLHRTKLLWCIKCGWEESPPEIIPKKISFERPGRIKIGPKKWKIFCAVCGRPFFSKWTVTLLCKRPECHKMYKKMKRLEEGKEERHGKD